MAMENGHARHLMRLIYEGVSYPVTQTFYLALFDGDPNENGHEISGGGYARQSVTLDHIDGNAPGHVENTNDVTFPEATEDWGTVTHVVVHTNIDNSSGYYLDYGELRPSQEVKQGDQLVILSGKFTIKYE